MRFSGRMLASALLLAPGLGAQVRLTLADAVGQALSSSPQLAVAAARTGVAEGLRVQAGLGPNPRLILQSENARVTGTPPFSYPRDADSYAYLAQTIETGGKRLRRVDASTSSVRRSELERELQRRQIASRVSAAYWAAVGARGSRDLLQEEATSFERIVQYHRDRVREGATAEIDLLRVEVERDRLVTLASSAAQDALRASITLFREMGQTAFPLIEFTESLDQPHPVALVSLDEILGQRPEIQVARAVIDQARAGLRLQQANAKTDPDAQLGYKRTAGFDTLYAAVQIPLPVRNRNQGQIAAAAAEIKVAEASLAGTEALVRAEVASAQADYAARRRLLDETLRPMRDRAGEVYRIAEAAYREGGLDILRLLDAERARIEAQLAYVRALSDFQQSAVALETAQGQLP